jgi:hypothetical protein
MSYYLRMIQLLKQNGMLDNQAAEVMELAKEHHQLIMMKDRWNDVQTIIHQQC